MNLFDFETHIDEIIRKRGKNYYDKGHVISVQPVKEGSYSITVKGTEEYNVFITLDESKELMGAECDCPYDMGLICKHIVAALYSIRNNAEPEKKRTKLRNRVNDQLVEPEKQKAQLDLVIPKDSFKDLLAGLPKEELLNIIHELSLEDEQIKSKLLLRYSTGDVKNEIRNCRSMIRKCISKYSTRNGYIPYENTFEALEGAAQVLERAERLAEENEIIRAVKICLCVFEELLEVYQDMDDSDGYAGSQLESAIEIIQKIVYGSMDTKTADELFQILLEASHMSSLDGWSDLKIELLDACAALCTIDSQRFILMEYLQQLLDGYGKESYGKYMEEQVIMLKYELLRKGEDHIEAEKFLQENIKYSNIRELVIQNALEKEEYYKVIDTAQAGELQDASLRGLVRKWKEYRYSAYEKSGQLEKQRELARELVMEDDFEYYIKLKKTHSEAEWSAIYPTILEQFEKLRRIYNCYLDILVEEKQYEKLLLYVKENPSQIIRYYKYLIKDYKSEAYNIFAYYAMLMAEQASDRKGYYKVCNIIRQLIKLGGVEQGNMLITKLKSKYPRRPAFIDELSKINTLVGK